MIKRESFFSIIIGLFLLIISPLIVHAAPEEIQPVKAGEYHCVSYPGIGTRVLTLFREPDGTVYFSLEGRNGYGLKNKDAFNREGQCCTLAGVFRQEGKRGILDAGSVDFSHPMELQLHHRAPVKIIYHAEIAEDEIHITQEEKEAYGEPLAWIYAERDEVESSIFLVMDNGRLLRSSGTWPERPMPTDPSVDAVTALETWGEEIWLQLLATGLWYCEGRGEQTELGTPGLKWR